MSINGGTATRLLPAFILGLFIFCLPLAAANFDIQPIRIELNEKAMLGKLTIKNVSDADFTVQTKAYEWSQNEKGDDVYKETPDIIVFPKIMTMAKGEERFIRLGANTHPGTKEKTYRIYVEEIPSSSAEKEGSNIRLYMKIGIPLFIKSSAADDKAEIDNVSMDQGKIHIKVRNSGNSHFIVTGINVSGKNAQGAESFSRDISGWYLLSGSEKIYETEIPADSCGGISNFNIELKTSKSTVKKQFPIEGSMCDAPINTANRSDVMRR
jgi:fimbrial chaperone protein